MKILFLVPYALKEAPSQRFRFEQYFEVLLSAGHQYEVSSFLERTDTHLFSKRGNTLRKMTALMKGFAGRLFILFKAKHYDRIFIHREATPVGPPFIEWILVIILRKSVIYDFDDAIWLTDKKEENTITRWLKWRSKVGSICRWSTQVSCGNSFLRDFAQRHNLRSVVNPTTIDTQSLHDRQKYHVEKSKDQIIVGWTGSHSTLRYLLAVESVLEELEKRYPAVVFLVIADRPPEIRLSRMEFRSWSLTSEIEDLARIDIGIMPLEADDWTRGKCGFKALQYMALEIPACVSPVGVNSMIVTDGVNGFLCDSADNWITKLSILIENPELRRKMGIAARKTVKENYSVDSNRTAFLSLFK